MRLSRAHRFEEATRILRQFLRANPAHVEAIERFGRLFEFRAHLAKSEADRRRNLFIAGRHYRKALRLASTPTVRGRVLADLGDYWSNVGRLDRALACFDEALRLLRRIRTRTEIDRRLDTLESKSIVLHVLSRVQDTRTVEREIKRLKLSRLRTAKGA